MCSASEIVTVARKAFQSGITKPLEWRKQQLHCLLDFFNEHEDDLINAVYADLRKPKHEFLMTELIVAKNEIMTALNNLPSWAKPTYASKSMIQQLDSMYIQKDPLGVVLILGAWNYPVQVTLAPLISAIAAGNCAVIKPSEHSENMTKLFADLLPQYIDKECFPVFCGGIPQTTGLLEQRFDHIFFTGSTPVGKIIMAAAVKHLTPVTLELGGKSPVYVDKNVHMNIVCNRVFWGKLMNAGQTCLAPDYILCHKDVVEMFIEQARKTIKEMLGDKPRDSPDFSRIINECNFSRLCKVIDSMPKEKLVIGGERNESERYIAPTLFRDVSMDDEVMRSELFGPILPIISVDNEDEAIAIINSQEKPLALYIFSNTNKVVDNILMRTTSGGCTVNDVMMHASSHNLPFGGVGHSGTGRCHGKWGFDNLTHEKSVCWRKQNMEAMLSSRYMPYSENKSKLVKRLTSESEGSGYCTIL